MMNEKVFETDYQGTKITIDRKMLYITGGLLMIALLLIMYREIYPALAITLLAVAPFAHEAGHYLIAKRHKFTVLSMTFEDNKVETKIPDLMTHKDIMEVAIAGEIVNGVIYLLASGAIFRWGQINNSPFIVLFIIVPAMWIFTWTREDSDFHVAMRAWEYHKAQSP